MVEDIEKIDTEVELHSLSYLSVLFHAGVRIDLAPPGEEELLRADGYATNLVAAAEVTGEGRGVEVGMRGSMGIQLLDWGHLGGIVQSDVGQSKVATGKLHVHREARVEPGYARDLPSLGIPMRAKEARKGKTPVIAGDKVMPHVPR